MCNKRYEGRSIVVKILSCMLVFCLMCVSSLYAATPPPGGETPVGYVADRGIFGVVYGIFVTSARVVEGLLFGRNGVRGLSDYFRVDKIFYPRKPKY